MSTDTLRESVPSHAGLFAPIRTVAFWAAIVAPIGYVPLLVGGLAAPSDVLAFGALFAANVAALVVGRRHGRD